MLIRKIYTYLYSLLPQDPEPVVQRLSVTEEKEPVRPTIINFKPTTHKDITPKSEEAFKELITVLDASPESRLTMRSINTFAGDDADTVFISKTSSLALQKRKELLPYLNARVFVKAIKVVMDQEQFSRGVNFSFKDDRLIKKIIQKTILLALFGIELKADSKIDLSYIFEIEAEAARTSSSESKAIQAKYFLWVDELYHEHIKQINLLLKDNPEKPANYLIYCLIEVIKKQNPKLKTQPSKLDDFIAKLTSAEIERYLKDPDVRALPHLLLPAHTLSDPAIKLIDRIEERLSDNDFCSAVKLHQVSDEVKSAIITEAIHSVENPSIIFRYTASGVPEADIPPNAIVFLHTSVAANSLFSAGPRRCPAADTIVRPLLQAILERILDNMDPTMKIDLPYRVLR